MPTAHHPCPAQPRRRTLAGYLAGIALLFTACQGPSGFERRSEARRLASALESDFVRAADAANRAVLAGSDEASKQAVEEARRAKECVTRDATTLATLLAQLGVDDDQRLLDEFTQKFAAYTLVDDTVLGLATEQTNLKAMRLSYGPVLSAADALVTALSGDVAANLSPDLRVLSYRAIADVREVQALEGPHIAEASDAVMTSLEQRMNARVVDAQEALAELAKAPSASSSVSTAREPLAHLLEFHAEVIALSRKNTNVRSLALTLGQKRTLTSSCQESLHALDAALAKRLVPATR